MSNEDRLVTRLERLSTEDRPSRAPGLPDDLLRDSARRLRVVALIYGGGFLVSEVGLVLSDPRIRAQYSDFGQWGPAALSIAAAVIVAALASSKKLPPLSIMTIGLVFEVVAAYGITFATYWGVYQGLEHQEAHLEIFGLSYVAAWILFFTIVVPNKPRRALAAAIAAGSAVPVTVVLTTLYGGTSITLTPNFIVTVFLMPYFLIVVTAYVGARVVYRLGTDVTRAREMGSYRLTERLGGGGMGEVWKAEHRMLARPAAIKLIRPDKLGGSDYAGVRTLQQRFEREAQATALMWSPHTIDVYDFGVTADGTFYYVMELLEGFDLETLVDRFGPVPSERAVHLLRQVCHSLAEAHEHDLIHRDIKPANVYVCRHGRELDFVKVLDFGLVKPGQGLGSKGPKLTAEHVAEGTPAYIAPEQACGEPVDGRTDLYALGCVAYWLVTGQLVFRGRTAMEIMSHHLQTPPVPPSERTELEISQELEHVILSCLEKDPSRRPQAADDLDQALEAVAADTPWTRERAREWWNLHEPAAVQARVSGGQLFQVD